MLFRQISAVKLNKPRIVKYKYKVDAFITTARNDYDLLLGNHKASDYCKGSTDVQSVATYKTWAPLSSIGFPHFA